MVLTLAALALSATLPALDADIARARVAAHPIAVQQQKITNGDTTITLTRGVLYPVLAGEADTRIGAVYLGDGHFTHTPTSDEAANHLELRTGHQELDVTFEAAVLRFTPGVWASLQLPEPLAGNADTPSEAERMWSQRFAVHQARSVEYTLGIQHAQLAGMLSGDDHFLYVEVHPHPRKTSKTPVPGWLAWIRNTHAQETERVVSFRGTQWTDLARHHTAAERLTAGPILLANKHPVSAEITERTIEATLDRENQVVHVSALVELRARTDAHTLELRLDEMAPAWVGEPTAPIEIQSITAASYVHHAGRLLIELSEPLAAGDTTTVSLSYDVHAVWKFEEGMAILPATTWVPTSMRAEPAPTSFTVCAPEDLTVISTGRVRADKRDKLTFQRCVRTTTRDPHPSFVAANYTCKKKKRRSLPRVRVCVFAEQEYILKSMVDDAVEIIDLYQELFGRYPGKHLTIGQLPRGAGNVAPESLVLLSSESFLSTGERKKIGITEPHLRIRRLSHEIAHQWWGHQVRPKTYHDDWLAESIAEYASALYVEHALGRDAFRDRLRMWREHAVGSAAADPIWQSDNPDALVHKGPWVIHMLRYTLGDMDFQNSLTSFAQLVDGRRASTEDFQAVCEKVHGASLDWFFAAWVKGTGIPHIEYEYEVQRSEGSKKRWEVTGMIHKKGIGHTIKVPVLLHFEGNRTRRVMVPVPGDGGPFRFTDLPNAPRKITVDPNGVLASSINGGKQ